MKYVEYVKRYIIIAALSTLGAIFGYRVSCYLGWREPVIFSIEYITSLAWTAISFALGGAFVNWYLESLK